MPSATRCRVSVIGHRVHGGGWLDECDAATRAAVAEAWRALLLAIEMETPTGKVGLIHADFPYDDWPAIHGRDFSEGGEEACLWSMDRHRRRCEQPIRHVRAVVQGHLTLPSPWQLGKVHYIDTGGLARRRAIHLAGSACAEALSFAGFEATLVVGP